MNQKEKRIVGIKTKAKKEIFELDKEYNINRDEIEKKMTIK